MNDFIHLCWGIPEEIVQVTRNLFATIDRISTQIT